MPEFIRSLGLGSQEGKPTARIRASTVYAQMFDLLFHLPALAGMGGHWELSKEEARELGEKMDALVKALSLDAKKKKQIEKALLQAVPPLAFASSVYMITWPRVQHTMELRAYAIQQNKEQSEGFNLSDRQGDGKPGSNTDRLVTWESIGQIRGS